MEESAKTLTCRVIGTVAVPGRWWRIWLYWLLQLVGVCLFCGLLFAFYDQSGDFIRAGSFIERAVLGAFMSAPVSLVIWGFSMLYWVPWMKRGRKALVQAAELHGLVLTISIPRQLIVRLADGYAADVARAPSGLRWSVTFMPEEGQSVKLMVEARGSHDAAGTSGSKNSLGGVGPPGSPQGTLEQRTRFGDALLTALARTRDKNRFIEWSQRLANYDAGRAREAFALKLPDGQGASAPYRTGTPTPRDAGFMDWATRNGLALAPGVTLCPEHLLVERLSGPIAFPLGATRVSLYRSEETGEIVLTSVDEENMPVGVGVPIADGAVRLALSRWLNTKNESWKVGSQD